MPTSLWPPRHVYVHVPFCARRCSYCDFSIAVRRDVPVEEFSADVARELDLRFGDAGPWEADTLYLGGGTPSRLGGSGVARLLDTLRTRLTLAGDAEVTIEANPDDVTAAAAAEWHRAGVNRLSIGSQSFDDRVLRWMHRTHDASAISGAVEQARAAGIDNISLDLIFALPANVERDWDADLSAALALAPQHLSLYGLTVEPHTPLGRWRARGQVIEAPDERYESEFLRAHEQLAQSGFEHYEVSNFARSGYSSRHNASYWSGAPYAGVGPSAHELRGVERRWNLPAYTNWTHAVRDGRDPMAGVETLDADNRLAEDVYLGLRTQRGLALDERDRSRVTRWIDAGWASLGAGNRLVLTTLGWLRLDALAADLTLVRSRY